MSRSRERHLRLVRLALLAFPDWFRYRYRGEMLGAFTARLDEVMSTQGSTAAWRLTAATCRDLVASGLRERFAPPLVLDPMPHPEDTRMNALLADLRYGLRSLRRRPAYALVAILTLGVGIGASTAMFSIANGVVLQPMPYPEPDRLVRVFDTNVERGALSSTSSPANFAGWRTAAKSFSSMMGYHDASLTFTGVEPPMSWQATQVSHEWTEVLRTQPLLGRNFTADEETWGKHQVVILGHGLWQRQFGSDPDIVGRSISLGGEPHTVVGVMPPGFAFPTPATELWIPLSFNFDLTTARGVHFLVVLGRLAPDATLASASAEMNLIMDQDRQHFEELKGWGVRLTSMHEAVVGNVRQRVMVFLGAVALLLLVACVNVANLSMAHAVSRFRELAVRAAMGAGRWRLTRQLAIEGILTALVAGLVGTVIAAGILSLVVSLAPGSVPRLYAVQVDRVALLFACSLSLVIGTLIGAVPALRAARLDLFDTLREGTRSSGGRGANLVRSGFVVVQVAIAVVIAVGAGLLAKSFSRLTGVDAGINTRGVLVANVGVPTSRYPQDEQRSRFLQDYVDRIQQLPGVEAAAVGSQLPLEGYSISFTWWLGSAPVPPNEQSNGDFRVVSPGYFGTVGLRTLRGRTFGDGDTRDARPVVVIDEALARQAFGEADPVGQLMQISYGAEAGPREIIGVVSDVRQRGLDVPAQPGYYLPLAQVTWSNMRVVVRTSLPPMSLADAMRRELAAMDPLLPLRNIATLDDLAAQSVGVPRFNMLLLGAFAALALILAASGIYSVMSYTVTQRTREIGVRMALGARAGQVQSGIWGGALRLGLLGSVIGLAIAFAMSPQVATLLFEVDVHDPVAFTVPPLLFLVVAWLGSYVPARRASRVDPVVALRAE